MEDLLGGNLADVRIHDDPHAAASTERLGARAYTRGRELYFDRPVGEQPSGETLQTLAHELTHAIQTRGRAGPATGEPSRDADSLEAEARRAARSVAVGRREELTQRSAGVGLLKQEKKGETAAPTVSMHPHEITPAHARGTINAGPFSISYRYEVGGEGEGASLILELPDGIEASFVPLGDVSEGGIRVEDPGGSKARTVRIEVAGGGEGAPRVRARFSKDLATHVVIFQFPV
jgi:hypothetical protein